MWSLDVFFVVSLNMLLNTPLNYLVIWDAVTLTWRHCNDHGKGLPTSKMIFSVHFFCHFSALLNLCLPYFYNFQFLYNEVERGVYWFHLVRPSVCPSVRLWMELCPLSIFNNTRWTHFIFVHLTKQLQKKYGMACCLQDCKIFRYG